MARKKMAAWALALSTMLSPNSGACISVEIGERADAAEREEMAMRPPAPGSQRRVVVITLDGVRWKEIFHGTDHSRDNGESQSAEELTPELHALAARGVTLGDRESDRVDATGPNFVSLPGYTEIFTGRTSPCQANDCEGHPVSTVADEIRRMPGTRREDVAVITSWERIERAATGDAQNLLLSTGRTHGETRERLLTYPETRPLLLEGAGEDPAPGGEDYRPDHTTRALTQAYFAKEKPRFLFVSLGDTDEYGHEGDYPHYLDALRADDAFIGEMVRTAEGFGDDAGEVTFIVTADHGRADDFFNHGKDYPDSQRSWMVLAGGPVNHLRHPTRHHRLADIAPTVRKLFDLPADEDAEAGVSIDEAL